MKRSSRSNRFGLGRGLKSLLGKRRSPLQMAGAAGQAEQPMEQLETRQLLAVQPLVLTITQVDPFTQLGTVAATFNYFSPFILALAPATGNATVTDENFDRNEPGAPPINIPNPYVWQQSKLRIDHTAAATLINAGGQQVDNRVRITWAAGQSVTLGEVGGATGNLAAARVGVTSMAFDVFSGLDFANTIADLIDPDGNVLATFTGPTLAALATGNRLNFALPGGGAFAAVRLTAGPGAANDFFDIDNVNFVTPFNRHSADEASRASFGARVVFSAPLGATLSVFDLYGRPMRYDPTVGVYVVGQVQGSEAIVGDWDADGVPNFNDGIGKIVITGSNVNTTVTMLGGKVDTQGLFTTPQGAMGIYDDFEGDGRFGFNLTGTPPRVTGLPPGSGSMIVGSPVVRDNSSEGTYYAGVAVPITSGFVRSDQGVFVTDGSSIGSVYIHGMVFGSSVFNGSVNKIIFGNAMGSVSVAGDVSKFVSSGDAAMWVDDDGAPTVGTGAQFTVGRTLGEMDVGGRSLMNVTVLGDLSRPALHQPRDVFRYYEQEWSPNVFPDQTQARLAGILNFPDYLAQNQIFGGLGVFFGRASQQVIFGDSAFRNDTLMGAEWVGSAASAVQINGDLGAHDALMTREDPSDVYAFAADGSQDIVVELSGTVIGPALGVYARLVDSDGRTLTSFQLPVGDRRRSSTMTYRPTAPGVYYLVMTSQEFANGVVSDINYVVTLSGMAATTLGAIRTAGGMGLGVAPPAVNVLNGSVGSLRIGTGYVPSGGGEAVPSVVFNMRTQDNDDSAMALRDCTISIPGNLYNITTGGDVEGGTVFLNVGGNLGTFITGQSQALGLAATNGDLRSLNMVVGGSIGMLDIRGAVGVDQDPTGLPKPVDPQGTVVIRTGNNNRLRGDIGMFRVGSYVGGGTLNLRTPNGSVVGGFLVQQDLADDGSIFNGIYGGVPGPTGVTLQLGTNSDLRFFDTPRIWQHNVPGITTALVPGQPVTFTDDSGQPFQITLNGGNANAAGTVKSIPVSGSLGSAVGRIEVNLDGGGELRITTLGTNNNNAPVVSIGRIVVTGSDAASAIVIDGQVSVDVWRIEQTGGTAFDRIENSTPNGDIVAADMAALNTLTLGTGDLGRTQVPAWGPQLIGPFLGIVRGQSAGVGGEIGLPGGIMTGQWNGNLFRPINNAVANAGTSWLDDVGSPVDPYLDGLIVRAGDIQSVTAGGAIGDVIAGNGNVINVAANFDRTVPTGRFEGIFGNIYGNRIRTVDIGSGLAKKIDGPMTNSSIVATDDINSITSSTPGAFISSLINAGNLNPGNADGDYPIDGVSSVQLTTGGSYIGAWIGSMTLDAFWDSFFPDDSRFQGAIDQLGGRNASLIRSDVTAASINQILLTDGFYDASRTESAGSITRVEAKGFRNSTAQGGDLEFQLNQILVGQDLGTLTTTAKHGNIEDLRVDVLGRTGEISGLNILRSTIDSDVLLDQLKVDGNLAGSSVTAGRLVNADIKHNLTSSVISISGAMETVKVGDAIVNSSLNVTGPDGRMGKITARTGFTGSVTAAGPVDTIEVTEGDLDIRITTFANQHGDAGNVHQLKASRDLILRTDIGGTVDEFIAGRHIGRIGSPGVILVHGTVKKVDVPNGQLYSDLRVGQNIETVNIGRVANKPGNSILGRGSIIAFGRINTVTVLGDFAGQISSGSGGIGVVTINDGSLLASASITALDGTITNVFINNGHLFGSIHADYSILAIRLNGGADGVFGDIGVNPALSSGTSYDAFRNQLPPNVIANSSIQGPRITAGFNIGRIILTNGSIFEAFIWAGRAIGTVDVTGDISNDGITTGQATVIAAGSSIFTVHATGNVRGLDVLAGIKGFGDDGRQGGQGANADTVRSGRITTVQVDGNADGLHVSAGLDAGADGIYNTFDELVASGISYVRSVTVGGLVSDSSVFADSPTLVASSGIITAGTTFPNMDTNLSTGAAVPGGEVISGTPFAFTWGGVSGTITFTGPGHVYWDSATGMVSLVNTKLSSSVTIDANGTLNNFRVVTNDDASVDHIIINAPLAGNSVVDVDAYALGIEIASFGGTGLIQAGMNLKSLIVGNLTGGFIRGSYWVRDMVIGNYGDPSTFDEARIDMLAGDTLTINGNDSGLVNVERELSKFEVTGTMYRGQLRVGGSLGGLKAGAINQSRISVNNNLGPVDVTGDVADTSIMAGGDLGEDAAPGGSGFNADQATTGSIESVDVGGNFRRSDVVAGLLRGTDGFFGTSDDSVAPGRSNIGDVTIDGTQVGSNLFTEQYRVAATGTLGDVTVGGQTPPNTGNFRVTALATDPTPIRVADLQVAPISGEWIATIIFNQAMDASSVGPALTISEVRNNGLTLIPLVQGTDYTIGAYNEANNSIQIVFSRTVTDRNLIPQGGDPGPGASTPGSQDPSLPGPGVFRFDLSADTLRARVANARLDGDADGFAATSENYSQDAVVGDAGDKFTPEVDNISTDPLAPQLIDMYGPADLDLVLDNNLTPDGLPDANTTYTVRGAIGDHPDNDVNNFRLGGDTDIYKITLQAGQILRLGKMGGSALLAGRFLYDANGVEQGGSTVNTQELPVATLDFINGEQTTNNDFLIKTTGVYFIVITNADPDFAAPGTVPNVEPGSGNTGDYNFTVQVFDDGDSGFGAANNSGNGTPVVNAPAAIVFAGPNGVFQNPGDPTYDDLTTVTIGDYRFTLDAGADGIRGTADDVVSGSNSAGITSTLAGGVLTSNIYSAIGPTGHVGVPGDLITSDVDIYNLNNGQTIAPGTKITVTVKLADLGADLGSFDRTTLVDYRGNVQFGLFDTTDATDVNNARLVFSPSDFSRRGEAGSTRGAQGDMSYGYDANGDFTITFRTPDHIGGTPGQAGKFALYIQGAFNTDYQIQVSQQADQTPATIQQSRQNIFIETGGGDISWLEAGGLTTKLDAYTTSVLGFNGNLAGMPIDQYVLSHVMATVQSIFTASGLNVVFSTDPSAFEFQDFSTIFLTSTNDPTTILNRGSFGYTEHSDPMNLNRNDEGVVFLPSFESLGYTPSQADVDQFVLSLSAAISRRAGELMGLRITTPSSTFDSPIDFMSANSVTNIPISPNTYALSNTDRDLSGTQDSVPSTNFFLGQQNAFALLDKFLTP